MIVQAINRCRESPSIRILSSIRHDYQESPLTYTINGAGFEVYNTLGYGFLEHVYVQALERELRAKGHQIAREYAARIFYKGEELTTQRLDLVVDEKIIVEVKATERLDPSAPRQLFNYLCATNFEIGLLLHFGPKGLGRFRLFQTNDKKAHRRLAGPSAEGFQQRFT